MQHTYQHPNTVKLESGESLYGLAICYHTWGTLNESRDNVLWICHALTANSDAASWWPGMVGPGLPFDTNQYFVVCANIPGSCYGSTGPLSINADTGSAYFATFPFITIRDMVTAHELLRQHLGIEKIKVLIGGSMGGYQALEWLLRAPQHIGRLLLLATSAAESAWGIGIHTAQRMAIEADSTFGQDNEHAGRNGLKAARAIGMLTYRNYSLLVQQQSDTDAEKLKDFKVSSYLYYQGEKLAQRFNAYSYYVLSRAMDSHNIARGRNATVAEILKSIRQPTLLIGISSDLLCPAEEQRMLAGHLPECIYHEIFSPYGHDGFLIETEKIGCIFRNWLLK
ncbi:MAG: homoserine O-acetyltransferase [Edaphocola sp.]